MLNNKEVLYQFVELNKRKLQHKYTELKLENQKVQNIHAFVEETLEKIVKFSRKLSLFFFSVDRRSVGAPNWHDGAAKRQDGAPKSKCSGTRCPGRGEGEHP